MKRNKYLEDLGVKRENYGHNFVRNRKICRFVEKRKYGFDHRETMHMDVTFAEWIYSRLMMFKEQTANDLTFHSVVFEGNSYTIEEAINRILKASANYIYYWEVTDMYCEAIGDDEFEKICEEMKTATRLWAEVMPYVDRVFVKDWQQQLKLWWLTRGLKNDKKN